HLGGEVVATGDFDQICQSDKSLTGQYLSGKLGIERNVLKASPIGYISINGCSAHNLKNVSAKFPLNRLSVVAGVSGSGKTTLIKHTLYPAMLHHLKEAGPKPGYHKEL